MTAQILKVTGAALVTLALAACGGSSGGGVVDAGPGPAPAQDSFFVAVNGVISTTSETTEPREIDSIAATTPETTEPSALDS